MVDMATIHGRHGNDSWDWDIRMLKVARVVDDAFKNLDNHHMVVYKGSHAFGPEELLILTHTYTHMYTLNGVGRVSRPNITTVHVWKLALAQIQQ